jgi:hypothetical protein
MKLALNVMVGMGLVGAAGALAACTDAYPPAVGPPGPPPPIASTSPPTSCFRTQDVDSHRVAGDRTVYVKVARRDVYRLDTSNACFATAGSNDPLVIRESSGVAYACRPVDLDISVAHNVGLGLGGAPTPCIVQSITRLTPAEVAALPNRYRP